MIKTSPSFIYENASLSRKCTMKIVRSRSALNIR